MWFIGRIHSEAENIHIYISAEWGVGRGYICIYIYIFIYLLAWSGQEVGWEGNRK